MTGPGCHPRRSALGAGRQPSPACPSSHLLPWLNPPSPHVSAVTTPDLLSALRDSDTPEWGGSVCLFSDCWLVMVLFLSKCVHLCRYDIYTLNFMKFPVYLFLFHLFLKAPSEVCPSAIFLT